MKAAEIRERLWSIHKTKARCSDEALEWLANYYIVKIGRDWGALAKYINTNVN